MNCFFLKIWFNNTLFSRAFPIQLKIHLEYFLNFVSESMEEVLMVRT